MSYGRNYTANPSSGTWRMCIRNWQCPRVMRSEHCDKVSIVLTPWVIWWTEQSVSIQKTFKIVINVNIPPKASTNATSRAATKNGRSHQRARSNTTTSAWRPWNSPKALRSSWRSATTRRTRCGSCAKADFYSTPRWTRVWTRDLCRIEGLRQNVAIRGSIRSDGDSCRNSVHHELRYPPLGTNVRYLRTIMPIVIDMDLCCANLPVLMFFSSLLYS